MTRDRLIEEATDVVWVERTKGGYRAARYVIGEKVKDERSVPA